jgi:hypothetical protein
MQQDGDTVQGTKSYQKNLKNFIIQEPNGQRQPYKKSDKEPK